MGAFNNSTSICMKHVRIILGALIHMSVSAMLSYGAAFPDPPSALVIQANNLRPGESASVTEISKIEYSSPIAMKVALPSGQSSNILKSQITAIFQYPNRLASLAETSDVQALATKRAEAVDLMAKYPAAKVLLAPLIAQIDDDTRKFGSGQVRLRGVWQSRDGSQSSGSLKKRLVLEGATYVDPVITRLDNGAAILKHEGGVGRVSLKDAPTELIALVRVNPKLVAGLKPITKLKAGATELTNAIILGQQDGQVVIYHDSGITAVRPDQLPADIVASLVVADPDPSNPTRDDPPNATNAGVLPRKPGKTPRDPDYGWESTLEEIEQWKLANKESLSNDDPGYLFHKLRHKVVGIDGPIPTYREIIQFINGKIHPLELGYNKTNRCMVLRQIEDSGTWIMVAFKGADLDANVRFGRESNGACWVRLETADGSENIAHYSPDINHKGELTLRRDLTSLRIIDTADLDDAKRIARAFSILIQTHGGSVSKF